ncbi:hypothetical protein AQUSIP_13370 [Aquicella siphonis]|uniref:Helix-turn-helix domain-containing protein n=1 Tax=Aquicella siphonis TaxID=254247 RepID=A0A5E4PI58_9COXI|nr:hypothetical protein [Aquicella siphonis]VVC76036.1 hypothetical protein AQUSIP_13370 [Aquicella siphonis]
MTEKATLTLKEAAPLLGFKGVYRLREKARRGLIPGAFKISSRWMVAVDEIMPYIRNYYKTLRKDLVPPRNVEWQSVKRKVAPTIILASRSAESECRNRLDALAKERRKNMKKNAEKK